MHARNNISFAILMTAILALGTVVATPVKAGLFGDIFSSSTSKRDSYRLSKKDAIGYEEAGKWWGERHRKNATKPGDVSDDAFVESLSDPSEGGLDYFWIHADLKEAFKKGYRLGYQDRTADLVLGPYLTEAAAKIGGGSAANFVNVVNTFEKNWAEGLSRAINVFVTLISEGSQADRERFIKSFEKNYDEKYQKTQADLKAGGFVTETSEGGTTLFLDARKTVAVLNIPSTNVLKTEIYRQTFKVMGDEWGKRFSHNLMRRDELVDILRRSKTALLEVPPSMAGNIAIVRESFEASYGTDATNVFRSLGKEAGYDESTLSASVPRQSISTPARMDTRTEASAVNSNMQNSPSPTETRRKRK